MSRALSAWLLACCLLFFAGCGGGGEEVAAVAENSEDSAPSEANISSSAEVGDGVGSGGGNMGDMYGGGYPGAEGGDEGGEYGEGAEAGMEDMYAGGYPGSEGEGGDYEGDEEMEGEYAAGYPGAEGEGPDGDEGMEGEYAAGYPGAEGEGPDGDEGMEGEYAAGYPGAGGEGYGGGPGGVAEDLPDGLEGKAVLAFRQGKDRDAIQYLYAHALTSDAGAESILPTIGWVGGLKQPKLAVRWGAGFVVTAPRNFDGDPKPIGVNQTLPTRGGNRGGGGAEGGYDSGGDAAGYETEGGGGGGGSNSLLAKGAGELGEKLVAAFTERVMSGDFGDVLKDANEGAVPARGGGGGYGDGGYGGGEYGEGGEGGYGGPGGPGGGGPQGGAASTTSVSQIKPGLSMLGIGTQKELIERARKDDIDVVVVIDVKLRVAKGIVSNDTTLSLVDAKTQKKLHGTKKLNNVTVQKNRDAGKADDVDKELEKLFAAIDTNFKMADLPAGLTAEVAAKRVNAIASKSYDNPLPILAEAKMYHVKGLLDENALFAAYDKVIGVKFGRQLATGGEEDKVKVLNAWLPDDA